MKRIISSLLALMLVFCLSISVSADELENNKIGVRFNSLTKTDDGDLKISITVYNKTDYETERFWLFIPWHLSSQIRIRNKVFLFGGEIEKPLKPHTKRTIKYKIKKKAIQKYYYSDKDIEDFKYEICWFVECGMTFYWGSISTYPEGCVIPNIFDFTS